MTSESEPSQSWFVGYCYIINSVIGSGIMALPAAYYSSGWLSGIVFQMFAFFISFTGAYQLLSTWSRLEALVQLTEQGHEIPHVNICDIFKLTQEEKQEPLLQHTAIPLLAHRKFDIYDMVRILLGPFQGKLIIMMYVISSYPWLAGYLSVFSSSLASNIPLFGSTCNLYETTEFLSDCKFIYWAYLSIFCTFIISLSCFHLHEHRYLQITMTFFRFIVIVLMLIASLYSILSDTNLENSLAVEANPPIINSNHFGEAFSVILFASLFQNIIPTSTSFVKDKSRDMKKMIISSVMTFNILYVLVGIVLCFAIKDPHSMVSLNFRNYSAGEEQVNRAWWTHIVSYSIVVLPALDMMSSFPLIATNFSDNLMGMAYGIEAQKSASRVIFM